LEGGLKAPGGPSSLCFLFRPPGGAGREARTPARLLVLLSSAHRPGEASGALEEEEHWSRGLLVRMNAES